MDGYVTSKYIFSFFESCMFIVPIPRNCSSFSYKVVGYISDVNKMFSNVGAWNQAE